MSRHLLNSFVLLPCIVESIRISSTFEDRLHVEALSSQGERQRATNVAGLPFFSGDNVEARTLYKASQLEFARRAEFSEFFSTIAHTAEKADLDGDYFSNRRKSTVSVHKDEKGVHHTWLSYVQHVQHVHYVRCVLYVQYVRCRLHSMYSMHSMYNMSSMYPAPSTHYLLPKA